MDTKLLKEESYQEVEKMYWRLRTPSVWREMDKLQREMNRLFSDFYPRRIRTAPSYPAVNIWTDEEDAFVTAEMPGINSDDIDISIVDDNITLSGTREPDGLDEETRYHRRERGYGKFTRTIQLPFNVDVEHVDAVFENGILQISLPRAEADKPRKISVKTS
ncbi:MAG: Hsp20/alpha crystallin family protein [Anaerolineales bacterium]